MLTKLYSERPDYVFMTSKHRRTSHKGLNSYGFFSTISNPLCDNTLGLLNPD